MKKEPAPKPRDPRWPEELDFGPEDVITHIENATGEKPDMTGEPLWKRIWFKILRIT